MSKKGDGQKRGTSPVNENPPPVVSCEICRKPDNSRMVACDSCGQWYHFECVSVDSTVQDVEWCCRKCLETAKQLPSGTSTPNTNTGTLPKSGTSKPTDSGLEEYLRKQLVAMQKKFERMMKEKEDQRLKELQDQRKKYEQDLKDTERRVLEQVERQHRRISSDGGGATANSTGNQPVQIDFSGGWTANSTESENPRLLGSGLPMASGGLTTDAIGNQPLQLTFGAGPTASSTGNPLPKINVQDVSHGDDVLAQELKLLEDKQALERRHLEERKRLLQRYAAVDGGAASAGAGLNPQATVFRPSVSGLLGVSSLSQSQISARQAVNKELPPFSGNPEEWPLFLASYENSTRICGYSDEENMLRLQRSLRGKALEAVRCRLLHPANLQGVLATLKTLFGRPEIIVHSLVNRIREMPSPKAEKLQTLIDFGIAVQNVCATITASGLDEYMCNVALLQELTERLPPSVKLNWAYHRQGLNRVTLAEFGDWLGKLVEAASIVTIPSISAPKLERRGRKEDNYINVHSESSEAPAKIRPIATTTSKGCVVCLNECSGPEKCKRFNDMDVAARWTVVKDQRLCRKCLREHFGACEVKIPCGKNGCSFMHHKLLHDDKRYSKPAAPAPEKTNEAPTTQSCNTHSKAATKVLFRYVPVTIYGKGRRIKTFAFLDDGSSATLMEHSLLKELGLKGETYPLCLDWTGGQRREEKESVVLALKVSGMGEGSEVFELPEVHTVRDLSLPKQSLSVPQMATKYSYLEGLPLKSYDSVSPRILIGMNNCRLGHALRSVEGGENEPVASKTRLGWIVYGPCSMESGATNSGGYHSFHICPCVKEEDKDLNSALREYFSIESIGIAAPSKSLPSKDEERAMNILSTETRLVGNRFETGLLWRYYQFQLPDNKGMALKRLACLQKRLKREPDLAVAMRAKMSEYEERGYIRRLSAAEKAEKHSNDWYLPIFPVTNPNKPGKLRIVFDAAAKVNGVSLNSFLLTGPDQLVSLLAVLYKFREFRIAVVGDIREMFFQVQMKKQDQRSQMILWNNGNPDNEPEVYAVTVMTFGAACSPSCAHYVKNRNADRFEEQYPRAVECIKYEHYFDDMLASVETEEEAVQLASDVRSIHAQGGFEIRNWLSNSSVVVESLHENSATEKNLSFCAEMATEKVLGMWWDTTTDTFTFKLSPKHDAELLSGAKMPTKREVLRTLMAIYDPMGLIANFLIYLKILLQEIWRSGCGWDDVIGGKLAEKWMTWIEALPNVRLVSTT